MPPKKEAPMSSGEKAAAKKEKAKENKAKANPELAAKNKAEADAKRARRKVRFIFNFCPRFLSGSEYRCRYVSASMYHTVCMIPPAVRLSMQIKHFSGVWIHKGVQVMRLALSDHHLPVLPVQVRPLFADPPCLFLLL